jgi:Co/Zn/Cd efflux system component
MQSESPSLSQFIVAAMDCPAEERMVRMALADLPGIHHLAFDLVRHELTVCHDGPVTAIADRLAALNLGARLVESAPGARQPVATPDAGDPRDEARTLRILLALNAAMFVIEMAAGWIAESTGLLADAFDMLADAAVYAIALAGVGRPIHGQRRAARVSGWLQLALGIALFSEIGRRLAFGSEPAAPLMIGVSLLALAVNVTCVALLARHRDGGAHMKASWIFSTNDALANLGVIVAGILVAWSGSNLPDLVIGAAIAGLVVTGAARILRLPP